MKYTLLLNGLLFVFMCHVSCLSDSLITSVNYVFEGFSPYSALRFFEFNDKGWKLSEHCLRDLYNYLEGLRRGTLWAVKLYDASGYYGGGALADASTVRIHNPNICRNLRNQYKEQVQHGTWSFLANATVVPFAVHIIMAHYLLEVAAEGAFKLVKVQQLICFPSSCNNEDLQQILDVYLFQSNHVVRNSTYLKHRVLKDIYSIRNDTDFYVLIGFLCSSLFIYALFSLLRNYKSLLSYSEEQSDQLENHFGIAGEFHNSLIRGVKKLMTGKSKEYGETNGICNTKPFPAEKATTADNLPKILNKPRSHQLDDILNAVSVHNVLYNLFGVDAAPQTGLCVLFTIMLIYEHLSTDVKFMASNMALTNGPKSEKTSRELQHASFLIDVYFFVHGSKMAREFVQTFPRKKLQVLAQMTHVLKLILQKTLSFLPSYAFCVFLEHLLVSYFYHSIALEIPSYDYKNCQNHKLNNILYLDSFFPLSERCMPWTWFMSLEVQFFIIACLVLLLAEIYPIYAIIIGVAIFVTSLAAASLWELSSPIDPQYLLTLDYELSIFHLVLDNICLRIQPYILGICLGYILQRTQSNMKINLIVLICGWLAYLLMLFLFIYGYTYGYEQLWPLINQWCRACLTTSAHIMWALMLLWISLSTMTNFTSWLNSFTTFKYFNALERLSSICLLIAPIVIKLLIFTADGPIYTSTGHIFAMFIGCAFVTYLCAFVLHVLFDGPLCAVMKVTMMRNIET